MKRSCEFELDETDDLPQEIEIYIYQADLINFTVDEQGEKEEQPVAYQMIILDTFREEGLTGVEKDLWLQLNILNDPMRRTGSVYLDTDASVVSCRQSLSFKESIVSVDATRTTAKSRLYN